jgi:phage host-nuclease inhibitor protein Gam
MARQRVTDGITDWHGVDLVIRQLDDLDLQIEGEEAELQKTIKAAKAATAGRVKELQAAKKLLVLRLQTFCQARKEEFGEKKSKETTFGFVGFQFSTKVILPRKKEAAQAVVARLKALGKLNCIQVKETPLKEEIKKLDEATLAELAAVGVRKESGDTFWWRAKREKILAQDAA